MATRAELEEILKSEYGIGSMKELQKALMRMGGLDVSMFCSEIKQTKEKTHEAEAACTA